MLQEMTLGEAVDKLYDAQKARSTKQKEFDEQIAAMKQKESELEQHILSVLQREKMSGSRGTKAQVSIKPKVTPQVTDWLALFDYIGKNNAFQLLQKRLGVTAWGEMVASGEEIPGVKPETFTVLHVTKLT